MNDFACRPRSCLLKHRHGPQTRIHFPGALYHVISRGNQRQKVYKDDRDYRRFETLLDEIGKRHSVTLYAYVLMSNHFHLLLEVSRTPLAKAMQSLLYRYTRYHNQRYRKIGDLFQGRYKAILCDRDSYLMELIRYLHLNPVRAGMVSDPKRYQWSSHGKYLQGKSDAGLAVDKGLRPGSTQSVLAPYDQAGMAIIALFASQATLLNRRRRCASRIIRSARSGLAGGNRR